MFRASGPRSIANDIYNSKRLKIPLRFHFSPVEYIPLDLPSKRPGLHIQQGATLSNFPEINPDIFYFSLIFLTSSKTYKPGYLQRPFIASRRWIPALCLSPKRALPMVPWLRPSNPLRSRMTRRKGPKKKPMWVSNPSLANVNLYLRVQVLLGSNTACGSGGMLGLSYSGQFTTLKTFFSCRTGTTSTRYAIGSPFYVQYRHC